MKSARRSRASATVVAVGDEVRAPELLHLDRGHVAIREGRAQARQPPARKAPPRAEVAVEVRVAVERAEMRVTGIARTPRYD